MQPVRIVQHLIRLDIQLNHRRIQEKHFFKVWRMPGGIDGVAKETTGDRIMQTIIADTVQGQLNELFQPGLRALCLQLQQRH